MSFYQGKVCIVTGGGSGLGRSLCIRLAEQGARVTAADLDEEAARETARRIAAAGGCAAAARVDMTDPAAVERMIGEVSERESRLDYMFNNAGITVIGEFRDLPLTDIAKVADVNLNGALNGTYFAYRLMAEQGFGHIVNTASGFGLAPGPTNLPYVMSKFGVVGLSETLRYEALDIGVKVSVVCPGYIRTPLLDRLRVYRADARDVVAQIPVKLAEPDDAARRILDGVRRNRAVIAFPRYVPALTFLYRYAPILFRRHALKTIRDFRKLRKEHADDRPLG